MNEFEAECIPGLEEFVEGELRAKPFGAARITGRPREGRIALEFSGNPTRLNALRTASAVYQILRFDVPRPRGLLGHEHLTRLLDALRVIVALSPPGAYATFHLSAAGADSAVFTRLREEIARNLNLTASLGPADLLIAVHPTPGTPRLSPPPIREFQDERRSRSHSASAPMSTGWQVSARISPLPLSARPWRVCNLPGALNATIASAMIRLADPKPTDRFLNVCCGSGTLMVERLDLMPTVLCAGIDIKQSALDCASENLTASGHLAAIDLTLGDATRLRYTDATIDTVVADLPYGQIVGSDANMETLYSGIVAEATRVVAPAGHLVVITTRRKLFEQALAPVESAWQPPRVVPLKVPFRSGYIQPSVYSSRRNP
jgi:23S rRNA G2445 N2-methylase RlmL